jgi:Ca-activated chloride channel homolog
MHSNADKTDYVMNRIILFGLLLISSMQLFAQEENSLVRQGNDKYVQKKYEDAQVDYLAALDKNTDSFKARFNLSDSYYKQKKYENAIKELSFLANKEKDKMRLASVYHNMGNSYFKMGKLNEAEDSYKKALRNNPNDMETKYNLAFVKRNKNQGGKGDSKDKNKEDKNKEEQKQQNKLSKEDADRMLDAMQQDEKKTLEKMKEQPKNKARSMKIEKAW